MKSHLSRLPLVLLGVTLVALLLFANGPLAVNADTAGIYDAGWFDDFESYTPCPCVESTPAENTANYFPWASWTHSGLPDSFVFTDRPHSPTRMLKAHGLNHEYGGSTAYRNIGNYPPFEIDFWAQSNANPDHLPFAGHRKTVGLELATGPRWETRHRGLLAFTVQDLQPGGTNQEIWGGFFEANEDPSMNGVYLGDWTEKYYHINVKYEPVAGDNSQVRITWTIDGGAPQSRTYDTKWYENELDYVGLWAGGGQVWFDDVRVRSSTDTFLFDTPEPPFFHKVYLPYVAKD